MPLFHRYIGIDYSGAETAESSLPGLRVYVATASDPPREEFPPPSPRKYWTRRGLAKWLCSNLSGATPAIVGIDHAFSFPIAYFQKYGLPWDWPAFLDDFQSHWPTDEPATYIDFIRDGRRGTGNPRTGKPDWFRLTERWTTSAKSVFHFDIQGSVAKSTHAGICWLRYLRNESPCKLHFWPFDGWSIPRGSSGVTEVYPSLWTKRFPRGDRNPDQHAAYAVSAWLRRADQNGSLPAFLNPPLEPDESRIAAIEGWILGVV